MEKSKLIRQIFLLTDGAVYDTSRVVDLVSKFALNTDSRVHTFGVGDGADTQLVK
jgi:hypothetical protein